MVILDRYVARSFVASYVILLGIGIGLYVMADMLLNLDEFTNDRSLGTLEVLRNMADYYGYNLPLYFSQLSGPVLALAASFTAAMMLKNRELTAIVASGVPLLRVAAPVFVCTLFVCGAWFLNQEYLLPRWAQKIARTHADISGQSSEGIYCARDANGAILIARKFTPSDMRMDGVYIIEPRRTDGSRNLVSADFAEYDPRREIWDLERGVRYRMDNPFSQPGLSGEIARELIESYPYRLSPEELRLRQASQWSGLLSMRQMNALVHSGGIANLPAIVMARHIRLTEPLFQFILLALSMSFFLTREPVGVLVAGGKSLLLSGSFFAVAFVTHGIINESLAALVAWFPILVFGPVAVLRLANLKT